MPEYKALPQFTMGIDDRTVTGIMAVHGNIDEGSDRSHPGLFGDGTVKGRRRAVFLWQHDSSSPPIATIDRIFDVSPADLPAAVKLYAPDATGGTAIQRTYLETERASEVLAGLKAGAISEMSYAYDPTKWDFEELDDGKTVRNLYTAELFDGSDVNWGLNPATSATGMKGMPLKVEQQMAHAAIDRYIKRLEALYALRVVKEGRRFSGATLQEIGETIATLRSGNKVQVDAITRLEKLIAAPEETEPKTDERLLTQQLYREWTALRQVASTLGATQ